MTPAQISSRRFVERLLSRLPLHCDVGFTVPYLGDVLGLLYRMPGPARALTGRELANSPGMYARYALDEWLEQQARLKPRISKG